MDEDLNAAMALGLVFDRMRELNRALDAGDRATVAAARDDLRTCRRRARAPRRAAGRLPRRRAAPGRSSAPASRTPRSRPPSRRAKQARQRKDFRAADAVRERLRERGILLEDTPSGTLWRAG